MKAMEALASGLTKNAEKALAAKNAEKAEMAAEAENAEFALRAKSADYALYAMNATEFADVNDAKCKEHQKAVQSGEDRKILKMIGEALDRELKKGRKEMK